MVRPSHKELSKKIEQARAAIENGHVQVLNMLLVVADAEELGIVIEDDLKELLLELLDNNYTGGKPPKKSYQQTIQGAELFAFTIQETSLNGRVYYKFSIIKGTLYLTSLHRDREYAGIYAGILFFI